MTRSVLRVCIWELRQALGDSGATPHYIETVGQQGNRFRATPRHPGEVPSQEAPCVGRQAELAALHTALEQAQRGMLQLVFIAGDPGIGKTTLVRQFLAQVPTAPPVWIGSGQCVEHSGTDEAYLPLLEALGRLAREPSNAPFLAAQTARALAHAETLAHPFSLAIALFSVAMVRQGRGEISLWLAQDKPDAAQGLLAELYDWFTEGLDTADLQAAKALLTHCQPVA